MTGLTFRSEGPHARAVKLGHRRLATLLAAFVALAPGSTSAAGAKKNGGEVAFDARGAAGDLSSGDPERVLASLERIRAAGKSAAAVAPLLDRVLARGLPVPLAKAALGAAGELGLASSAPFVATYTRHRDPELRRAALSALLRLKSKDAAPALRQALADADARVRAAAASGLGALGEHAALSELSAALDRNVYEAAASIGQLCRGAECDALEARLGKLPLDVMTSAFDAIFFRSDVVDDHKAALALRVRDLGTTEANKYLRDVLSRWTGSSQLKAALGEAIAATRTAPGGAP